MGGVCLNIGCIPTKALLHSADLLEEIRESKTFGISVADVSFDLKGAMKHKQKVVRQSSQGVAFLMKKNKVDVYEGWGTVESPTSVRVKLNKGDEQVLQARHILLATGAKPREMPGTPFDHQRIMSSTDMLDLQDVPPRLLVIGAGAIGVEFASMFLSFGSQVTLVEAQDRIVPLEDAEVSAELAKAFKKRGMNIITGASYKGVQQHDDKLVATIATPDGSEQQHEVDKMLIAIGIVPRTHDIGLEANGIKTDQRGFVEVDGLLRTSVPGVFAIGDCINTPWLAHIASAEGIMVAEQIAGMHVHEIDYTRIPACTYCNPEVASVGLTEQQARDAGYEVKVGKFPFAANGKARVLGQATFGFVKIVTDAQYDEVLGMHIIGPKATELISEGEVAISHEATSESLMHTIHSHPTLHEAVVEAAHHAAAGAPIHM